MSRRYPVSLELVQDYLESLQPTETCGHSKSAGSCLISLALAWRYGKRFWVDGTYYWPDDQIPGTIDEVEDALPNEIRSIALRFDAISSWGVEITRREAELGIPILRRVRE